MTDPRCDCGAAATETVTVSSIPGDMDGKLLRFEVCELCYVTVWSDGDLSREGDLWALTLRDGAGAKEHP